MTLKSGEGEQEAETDQDDVLPDTFLLRRDIALNR